MLIVLLLHMSVVLSRTRGILPRKISILPGVIIYGFKHALDWLRDNLVNFLDRGNIDLGEVGLGHMNIGEGFIVEAHIDIGGKGRPESASKLVLAHWLFFVYYNFYFCLVVELIFAI